MEKQANKKSQGMVGDWTVRAGKKGGREELVEDGDEGRRKRGWIRPQMSDIASGQLKMGREAAEKMIQSHQRANLTRFDAH